MMSLFDSTLPIDENNAAVTVAYHGRHAILLIEIMHPDTKARETHVADYLPINRPKMSSIKSYLSNIEKLLTEPESAEVRYANYSGDLNIYDELVKQWGITSYTKSPYRISRDKITKMTEHIRKQRDKQINVPLFHIRGIAYRKDTYNCRSWVRSEVKLLGIDIPESWIDSSSSDTLNNSCNYGDFILINNTSNRSCSIL